MTPKWSMDISVVPPLVKKMFLKIPLLTETLFPEIEIMLAAWGWGSEPWIPFLVPKPGAAARQTLSPLPFSPEISLDFPSLWDCLGTRANLLPRDGVVQHGGYLASALPFLPLGPMLELLSLPLSLCCQSLSTWEDQTLQTSLRSGWLLEGAKLPKYYWAKSSDSSSHSFQGPLA